MSIQRYVSSELTHFVGRRFQGQGDMEEKQYSLFLDILQSGELGTSGDVKVAFSQDQPFSGNEFYRANMVCFSDIPLADLDIHMAKFSSFGLAFAKAFLIERGANPVFYVAANALAKIAHGRFTPRDEYFDQAHAKIMDLYDTLNQGEGLEPEIAEQMKEALGFLVYHFFSFTKFFSQGLPSTHEENYYMEREWRIFGRLDFSLQDVKRVIIPSRFAKRFRGDLPGYFGEIAFS